MKKIILAVTLVALVLGIALAQKNSTNSTKECACKECICDVTTEKMAKQPASKAYVIEPGKGTVYRLAPGIDYSRVRIRTSDGERAMSDLVKPFGKTDDTILVGAFADLSMRVFGQPAGGSGGFGQINRNGIAGAQRDNGSGTWSCKGYKDCNDLDKSGLCFGGSNGMSCNQKTHSCVCLAKD